MDCVPMKWGMICSIENKEQVNDFEAFGRWMITELGSTARKLCLGHRFAGNTSFTLYAVPGSAEDIARCYKEIRQSYVEVSYVIHVLPSKDSLEFRKLKEMTMNGALIGQGVLAENALNHFKCYQLEEVMQSMNQWICRRLAQITARQNENNNKLNRGKKDSYKMLIVDKETGDKCKSSATNEQLTQQPNFGKQPHSFQPKNWTKNSSINPENQFPNKSHIPTEQEIEYSVGVVLHRSQLGNEKNIARPPSVGYQKNQQFSSKESDKEKEVIVKGFPFDFNKFQIASLFSDFRPIHVEYRPIGTALVQFANKYHAAQVIKKYDGYCFEDENFTLKVCSAGGTPKREILQSKLNELQNEKHAEN